MPHFSFSAAQDLCGFFLKSKSYNHQHSTFMIAADENKNPEQHDASLTTLPASTRVYVNGQIHPDIRVPMREISLSDTKSFNGRVEKNPPVRVYDCSGPWGDEAFTGTAEQGLPALRREWILQRGDAEAYDAGQRLPHGKTRGVCLEVRTGEPLC